MIADKTETLISLAEAAKAVPSRRAGRPTHISCIYRWTTSGVRGVVLESIQIGGSRFTSREAISRFFAALTQQSNAAVAESKERTSAILAAASPRLDPKAIERAKRRLAKAGI
jgi:hypothetical protein